MIEIRRYCCEGAISTFDHLVPHLYFSHCFVGLSSTDVPQKLKGKYILLKWVWIFHCWYAFQVCFLDPGEIWYVLYKILRREILSFNIQLRSTNYTNLEVRISIGVLFSRILILNQIFQKTIEDFSYCFLMGKLCDCKLNYLISWNGKQLNYNCSHKNSTYYIFDAHILIFIELKTLRYTQGIFITHSERHI